MLIGLAVSHILEIIPLGYIKTFIFYFFQKKHKEIISKHYFVIINLYFFATLQANY